jgi:hypothetical protein
MRMLLAAVLAAGLVTGATDAMAAKKVKKDKNAKPAAAPEDKDKPYQDWKKVPKDAEARPGYLTLHQKRENLYLELKGDQFDKPVLGIFSLSGGIGRNFVLGGLPVNDRLLEFHRSGDRVLVVEKNIRFQAPEGSPIAQAKDLSYGNSVIASLKIESVQDSSTWRRSWSAT